MLRESKFMTQDIRDKLNLSKVICEKLKPLCDPLAHEFGISTCGYRKFFSDGTCFDTSSNFEWTKFVQEKFCNILIPNYEKEVASALKRNKYFALRMGKPDPQDLHLSTLYECDVWNTLSIYKKNEDAIDAFYFTSTRKNYKIISTYFNNLEVFEKFTHFFKDKIKDMINPQDMKKTSFQTISPKVFEAYGDKNCQA
jgi:hypothetical protein